MYGASKTHSNLYMFLEYCKDGDLKEKLKQSKQVLSEQQIVGYF